MCFVSALLLSALKSTKVPYNPAFIKKIIENTATPLGKHDPFSIGHGVIQVCKIVFVCCCFICILISIHDEGLCVLVTYVLNILGYVYQAISTWSVLCGSMGRSSREWRIRHFISCQEMINTDSKLYSL